MMFVLTVLLKKWMDCDYKPKFGAAERFSSPKRRRGEVQMTERCGDTAMQRQSTAAEGWIDHSNKKENEKDIKHRDTVKSSNEIVEEQQC